MNKLYYSILSDGVLLAYAAKSPADGEPGYLKPVIQALNRDLNPEEGKGDEFAELVRVAAVLNLCDPKILKAKEIN